MRLFGSGRIASMMDKLGLKEGEVIQHSMITKSIERAQKKVEENNFGIRKRLLEYDDVMNSQREVIYKKRKNALKGERIDVEIANMKFDVTESIVENHQSNSDFGSFSMELLRLFSIESPVSEEEFLKLPAEEIISKLNEVIVETYRMKVEIIAQQAFPVIKDVYEKSGHQYENIVVPVSDGQKVFQVITNLKKSYETGARDLMKSYQKSVILNTIDEHWKEHLREMDELKQSVQTATYEQKDPLLIYKFESFELFKTMVGKVYSDVISTLMKGHIPLRNAEQVRQADQRRRLDMSRYETSRRNDAAGTPQKTPEKIQPVRVEKKVGRNEPCPCGSGKKYKQCHGKVGVQA